MRELPNRGHLEKDENANAYADTTSIGDDLGYRLHFLWTAGFSERRLIRCHRMGLHLIYSSCSTGSYRIIKRGTDSFSLFFIHGWSTKYTILSEAETNRGHILRMYEITFLLIFALAWLTSPKGPAPLDRVTKESIQSALSNFEGPRKGKIEGEEFRPYRDYDQNIYEKGMQLVKGEPKSLLPIWVTGEWTLRSQGGCALQCIASSFCIAFQVASVERGYWCRTFRSVKTIVTSEDVENPVSFLKKVSP